MDNMLRSGLILTNQENCSKRVCEVFKVGCLTVITIYLLDQIVSLFFNNDNHFCSVKLNGKHVCMWVGDFALGNVSLFALSQIGN